MREDTKTLIDRLAGDAAPVKPLRAPLLRAAAFVATLISAMALVATLRGNVAAALPHFAQMPYDAEHIGALIAGIGAILAAAMIAIPGRSPNWIYLPLPGIVLWLLGGGLECYQQIAGGYVPTSIFASKSCFRFIVGVGIPTAIATYVFLRRNLAINAARVVALAGFGAALLASALLQLVDAHGTNPVDFATHIAAVALLALVAMFAATLERPR